MPIKGTIQTDVFPTSKYVLIIGGMMPLTILSIGALEEELETIELPDRTRVSNGNTKPLSFDVVTPAHHLEEQIQWEEWWSECKNPVSSLAYRIGTMAQLSASESVFRTSSMSGLFIMKKSASELDMANDSDFSKITWTLSANDVYLM